jgi:hypothetical protein
LAFAGVVFSAMCLFLPLTMWLRVLLMLMVLLLVVYNVWRYALLRLPNAVIAISVNKANQLHLVLKNGQQIEVIVQPNTVVTAFLTVLNCVPKEATTLQKLLAKHVVILADAVDVEQFRQLRVWLRWAKLNTTNQL